jgi:predicted AAA+ superfamily ATPase
MDGLKRNDTARLEYLLDRFPVVAIVGTRQSGKTTLSKQLRPNWLYMDLENPRDYDRISYDPLLFFEQNPHAVIIDEAQTYPQLFNVLRGIIDSKREQKNRFILTGSSSPDLIEKISESLAGRIACVELSPLKCNELYQQPLSKFYDFFNDKNLSSLNTLHTDITLTQIRQHWLYGGYPEPGVDHSVEYWLNWMEQYRGSYINRDMAQLFPKLDKITYRRFLSLLAKLSSTIINKADLARNLEISQPSIQQYLTIADGTFIWRNIPSFDKSIIKSVIKMPKGIIRDSGLLHYLLKIQDEESLLSDPIVGLSFEGYVIEEILRGLAAKGIVNYDYYYYRTKDGAEIDLILEGTFGIVPIEIKYGSYTSLKNLKVLQEFVITNNLGLGIVINQANKVEQLTDRIIQIPINYL